ncbi:MAG: hypothetical protein HDT22_00450 [Ruminococcus sp.]|nr:hypothetical protein [Ruminococcus sp.]
MKKQIIKKKVAFLLALCMVSNFSIAVGAEDIVSGFGESKVVTGKILLENDVDSNTTSDQDPDQNTDSSAEPSTDSSAEPSTDPDADPNTDSTAISNAGRVEVSIGLALFLDSTDFTVQLTGTGGNKYHEMGSVAFETEKISVSDEEDEDEETEATDTENEETASENSSAKSDDKTVVFSGLESGTYMLMITAKGFKTYKQLIDVKQKKHVIKLTAGFANFDYERGLIHPGVLLIGDVDNDGDVDDADRKTLVNAIHTVRRSPEQLENYLNCDLDGDGNVNIEDLMFFSKGYLEEIGKHTDAHVEEYVSPDLLKVELPKQVELKGEKTIEDMLNGEGEVSIGLKPGEELSEDNPIEVSFDVQSEEPVEAVVFGISEETPIEKAFIDVAYVDDDGIEKTISVPFVTYEYSENTETENDQDEEQQADDLGSDEEQYPTEALNSGEEQYVAEVSRRSVEFLLNESEVRATLDKNGNIQVNLGKQVAVKKVSLKVTALAVSEGESNNLVTIAKTEFVNDMASRIPDPELNIPVINNVAIGSEEFTVSWNPETNITGYEVQVKQGSKVVKTISTTATTVKVKEDKVIKNYVTYTVNVRSINGTWKSDYSESKDAMPVPTKRPDKPDNVKASGVYRGIKVGWSNMDDTQSYIVFYKKIGDEVYTEIPDITSNSYTIEGLEDVVEYEIYVKGKNELGLSPESIHTSATTASLNLADMPKYKLINRDKKGVPGKSHITSVTRYGGEMIDSELDEGLTGTAWGAVDGEKTSYYSVNTYNDGGWGGVGNNGLTYTFDKAYKLDTIGILTTKDIEYTHFRWWDENGKAYTIGTAYDYMNYSTRKLDSQGRPYYLIKLPYAITATKIQICLGRYLSSPVTISETYFYHYDTLMDEVFDLYVDDLHTVLREDVTQETVDEMRVRINTPDEFGEINPNKDAVLRELETAEKILNAESLSSAIKIHNGITTNDVGRGFSGINAWQPLGVSIGKGEEVTIYVGCDKKKTGDSTNLRLITTQYHSESSGVTLDGANLKVGANTFKLSSGSMYGFENGGAMYIQYQGASNAAERYSVRVTGGSEVPMLDLYQVTDENERLERTIAYINKLDAYVPTIEALHNELHKGSQNKNLNYEFDNQNCILGASDILLDTMMYSLPAQQLLAGAGTGTVEERAARLLQSMDATEDMMYLFYQHKGLNKSAAAAVDQIPKGHLNIRYQRMFSGAFMYASGNHIGIEWGSVSAMANAPGVTFDENGQYISGNYFGWGIAHEIGHNINQGSYAVAEITNNYFAQLAQAQDKNEGMRFTYDNIYSKVTSGTKGNCSNIATQLGMYWQLHIAYDKGLNYKTYANYNDQLANLFYARVDTYSRTPSKAPAPGGVALALNGDTDQQLMRLACAAAQKDVLEFFRRWGKEPDINTVAYASQFEKETRAIMYANDDSRVYALNGKGSSLNTNGSTEAIESISVKIGSEPNKVNIKINANDTVPENDVLLYEVIRCTISGGKVEETPVGYTKGTEFTDTISTMNNRTVFYRVRMVDQYLNYSKVFETDTVKIEHDGSIDKTNWSISTTGLQAEAVVDDATDEMPCEKTTHDPAEQAIDNNTNTAYEPKVTSDNAEIVLNFNQTLTVSGFKYTPVDAESSIKGYKIFVKDAQTTEWVLTANGTFKGNGSQTVYFANSDKEYVSTYSATALKVVLLNQNNQNVSIAELDVLAPTGDNVDFRRADEGGAVVIGILGEDYKYAETTPDETTTTTSTDDSTANETTTTSTDDSKANETTKSTDDSKANETIKSTDDSKANETTTSTDDSKANETTTSTDDSKANETTTSIDDSKAEETKTEETKHPYTIPKGSLVFTGSYKGNPAYNVVLLYDEKGNIVGGTDKEGNILADQIILADVPEEGDIANVSSGTWVYWIEPEYLENMKLPEKVRVELYRVNDALTNEGQRLVSDSLFEKLEVENLSDFPTITFSGDEVSSENNDDATNDNTKLNTDVDRDKNNNTATTTKSNTDVDRDKNNNTTTTTTNSNTDVDKDRNNSTNTEEESQETTEE